MLDGRLTYMTGEDLLNLLESMPAENIKSIEVLNNPSSKYDAEGGAGMLNINLKKNTLTGFSGSLYGGYVYGRQQLFNGGVNQQAASINLRYSFSKGNAKKRTRSTNSLEEMNRVGS